MVIGYTYTYGDSLNDSEAITNLKTYLVRFALLRWLINYYAPGQVHQFPVGSTNSTPANAIIEKMRMICTIVVLSSAGSLTLSLTVTALSIYFLKKKEEPIKCN